MKIKNFKRKGIRLSVIFIIAGMLLSLAGFGAAGFDYQRLKEGAADAPWYQTIHTDGKGFWYGVDLGEHVRLEFTGNNE